MRKKLGITAVVAALTGGMLTYEFADRQSAPAYVFAQDQQHISLTFAPVVKKALPAVVNITSETKATQTRSRRAPQGLPPGLEEFFGFGLPQEPPRRGGGAGSGVIVTQDGYVLTNNHVVENADEVTVTLQDRREFPAKVVGTDPRTDVAVLKIKGEKLPVLPISDSTQVQIGDIALAIGNPFSIGQTVTMGIISATGRAVGLNAESYEDFIQTDAAINPGNSGGALINSSGQLIGINTAIISRSGGNQGIGFAIPINMAREVMDQLVKTGKVTRGYMGAYLQEITPELARAFNLSSATGAVITKVEPNGPAAQAGLKAGDVVTAVNGTRVDDVNSLRLRVSRSAPGSTATLTVQRPSGEAKVDVKLGTLPERGGPAAGEGEDEGGAMGGGAASGLPGVNVTALTPEIATELQLPENTSGVVVSRVESNTAASEAGLRRGDVIQQVNRRNVSSVAEFEKAVGAAGKDPVLLLVNRGGATRFVVVEQR